MSIVVVPFSAEHLEAVVRFSERYFERPRTAAFHHWRYIASAPFTRMYVALKDGECLAMVSALRKTYRIAGEPTAILEVFDWHCLPEWKGSGAGLRVMRAMMREGPPILSVGGTADVHAALPAMGWRALTTVQQHQLPLSGAILGGALERKTGAPARLTARPLNPVARAWFHPRPRRRPAGGAVVPTAAVGDEVLALYQGPSGYRAVQSPDRALLHWMTTGYSGSGHFTPLCFTIDGRLRGWVLTRTYETEEGREGALVEIFAPRADASLYSWMTSEAAAMLEAFRPRRIVARATCPHLRTALRENRFREEEELVPVHVWPPQAAFDAEGLHLTLNHTDEPLRPYPSAKAGAGFVIG